MNLSFSERRSKNYFLQLRSSLSYKFVGILISFISIPLMIKYLGNEQYGIWSTIFAIFSWIVLFDIGIGNGLRNKLSEAIAKEKMLDAQKYVSTGYIIVGFLSLWLLFFFNILIDYVDWQVLFNTINFSNEDLRLSVKLSGNFLIVNFWLSLINQIANAVQKSSIVVLNQFLSNVLFFICLLGLYYFTDTSLVNLVLAYGISLTVSNIIVTIFVFKNHYNLIPKLSYFSKIYIQSITSLGFKFFIIQIAVVVIFTTDKIMITQLFGPEYVTDYDVVFKLFSIITIVHSLLLAPLWSAYSDAYHREDFKWIKKTLKNQLLIYLLIVLSTIILMILAKDIIHVWIGSTIKIDNMLIISMGIFISISTWNNIFAYFLNGINKLNIQIITSVIAIIINIPLSILLVKYFDFQIDGIVFGTVIALSLFAILGSIQTTIILKKRC